MSSRPVLVPLLGVALVAGCAALFFWDARVALFALAFMLGGALVGRLWPAARTPPAAPTAAAREKKSPREISDGALLDAMMDGMREGVLVVDGAMQVVASNHAAREIFGGYVRPLVPRQLSEVTRDPSIHAAFQTAIERRARSEAKVEMHDAGRRVFDLYVAPLSYGGGSPEARGAIGVFFDITRLERLEGVRQEFLSNVSHELRTPLTAILAFVETLEEGGVDDAANHRRFLSVIRRNAERMHDLIDDILELSAIEAGNVPVEPRAVALRPLVGHVLTAIESRAAERGVELVNEVAAGVTVRADARRLEQMLTNLVDNAVKFNREGGRVHVAHARAGRADRVTVRDTGEGIPPEHLPRIFERFYRVDRARSRALGGTGLGLAIVKHLARAHGGEATVRSTPGTGSTFTIELPAAETNERAADEFEES
ncbi:MAG TPA: ATP-binding protein [Pyrinomonadaceae bacterium]|nr:ATP-binding protein [Pyrinomonadaceae bacterium]